MPLNKNVYAGEKLENMWRDNPHCYWCGVETLRIVVTAWKSSVPCGPPPDLATRDHLYNRLDKEKRRADQRKNGKRSSVVLACFKCTSRRGRDRVWQEMDLRK